MKKIILVLMLAFGVGMANEVEYYCTAHSILDEKTAQKCVEPLKQTCEQAQYGEECEHIGNAFYAIKEYKKADFFYNKACEKYMYIEDWSLFFLDVEGNGFFGCVNIGNKYLNIEDYEKAKFYYKKACVRNKQSCNYEARINNSKGWNYFEKENYTQARIYLKKACEKDKSYCDYDAKIDDARGNKYLYSKDYKQAEIYYKKACEKDKKYCDYERKIDIAKGESYEDYLKKGNKAFFAKDYKQAEIHYKKACEKQAPNDDYSAFKDFRQNCNAHSAMEYFGKACSNGGYDVSGESKMEFCMQVGDMYYDSNKEMGVEKNIPLAKKYWAEALNTLVCHISTCIGGWDSRFYDATLSYLGEKTENYEVRNLEIKPDYTKARLLAEIACEKDEPIGQACEILGDIYAQGKGVKQNLNKAKNLYQKACENPSKSESGGRGYRGCGGGGYTIIDTQITHFGCKKLGDIYYLGKNFTEAKKWWAKAFEGSYEGDERRILSAYYQEAEGYYNGYIIEENVFIEKKLISNTNKTTPKPFYLQR